jgi:hypothetical protein
MGEHSCFALSRERFKSVILHWAVELDTLPPNQPPLVNGYHACLSSMCSGFEPRTEDSRRPQSLCHRKVHRMPGPKSTPKARDKAGRIVRGKSALRRANLRSGEGMSSETYAADAKNDKPVKEKKNDEED